MDDYDIEIHRVQKEQKTGEPTTEIWATINDKSAGKILNKRLWWTDENGVFHDETPTLPVELRNPIDNKWIEQRRKW